MPEPGRFASGAFMWVNIVANLPMSTISVSVDICSIPNNSTLTSFPLASKTERLYFFEFTFVVTPPTVTISSSTGRPCRLSSDARSNVMKESVLPGSHNPTTLFFAPLFLQLATCNVCNCNSVLLSSLALVSLLFKHEPFTSPIAQLVS